MEVVRRRIVVRSSLSPDAAARQLAAALAPLRWFPQFGDNDVQGWVRDDRVRIELPPNWSRNSWQRILFARIVRVEGGCELIGTFRAVWGVRVFTAVSVAVGGMLALLAVVGTVISAAT